MSQSKVLYFISKDSNWQKYRNDIMKKLALTYGLSIKVLTTGKLKTYIQGNASVEYVTHRSWLPLEWKLSFFPGALWRIVKDRPDVVLCLAYGSQLTEHAALPICKFLGIRFVYWTHGYHHGRPIRNRFFERLREQLQLCLLKRADAVITFSESGQSYLTSRGVLARRIFCAPNTLDTDSLLRFALETRAVYTREIMVQELGLPPDCRVVLFSGRLLRDKKVDDAILAIGRVIERFPKVHLVIVGDGPERDSLEQLAEAKIPGHFSFLGEVYDEEILSKIFSVAEIFLMPGYVGLAIVHAFCFGLPLITERVKIHSPEIQYLHDGYNGFWVDEDDTEGLAVQIEELLGDKEELARMSRNAVQTVKEEASMGRMLKEMARALGLYQ